MSAKFCIVIFCVFLLFGNCFAANLGRIPTQAQIEKYCVGVRLKIDGDLHYFIYSSIKSFDNNGLIIVYGRNKDKENFISRDEILNFDEAQAKYQELKKEIGGIQ